MKITLQQVKKDIDDGKSKYIFYSAHTQWWTHLTSDLEEAIKTGKESQRKNIEIMLKDDKIPEAKKTMLKAHLTRIDDSAIPLDPIGSPLMQTENCREWIEASENKPEHFGKYGLESFMKAHHQNCNNWCPTSWEAITEYLTRVKELEKIKADPKSDFEQAIDDNTKKKK